MNNKKIYIAGKISGLARHEATKNFGTYEKILLDAGATPVNPLNIVDPHEDSWERAMRKCIIELMQCDEAHFLPCWIQSPGASVEHDLCLKLGIPITLI